MHRFVRARTLVRCGIVAAVVLLASAAAIAQSAFSGVVRDTSGAVLPARPSRPPVRPSSKDAHGRHRRGRRYSIVDLRPGTYLVVFTRTGFNTFRREGLELPANFRMLINADLLASRSPFRC